MEKILVKRLMKGKVFLVKWVWKEEGTWEPARDLDGSENLINIFDKAEVAGTNKSDVVADFSVNNDDMGTWNNSNAVFVKTEALRTHKN